MPYEDLSTQYPSIRGISVDLPFVKFKYVKVDPIQSEKSNNTKRINVTVPAENRPHTSVSRMILSREAEVTTLGMDSMISYASVIHELTYGRIDTAQGQPGTSAYPAAYEPAKHSLDFII